MRPGHLKSSLERSDSQLINESIGIYFKDIFDHVIAVIDSVETFRNILSGMMDVYLSSVSDRLIGYDLLFQEEEMVLVGWMTCDL
jgi:Mg2+ and Co2+ transporter CorA